MAAENGIEIFHKPDWPTSLTPLLGNIVGLQGYVTEQGTIRLIGTDLKQPSQGSKYEFESDIDSPTAMLSAESSFLL